MRGSVVALLATLGCGRVGFDSFATPGPGTGSDAAAAGPDATACPTCDQGLIARWKFDETGGTTAVDDVGGHDGTLTGAVAFVPNGARGGAIQLSGGYVRVGWNVTSQITNAITVAEWINTAATSETYARYFASYWYSSQSNGSVELDADSPIGGLRCLLYIDGGWGFVASTPQLTLGTWQHVACVYDGSQLIAYVNGVAGAASPATGNLGTTQVLPIAIGAGIDASSNVQARFAGMIDDVRIYARGLDPIEIAALAAGS